MMTRGKIRAEELLVMDDGETIQSLENHGLVEENPRRGTPPPISKNPPPISQLTDGGAVSLPSTTDGVLNGPSTSSEALTGSGDATSIPVTVEEMTVKSARANIQGDFRATSCSNDGI